MKHPTTFLTFFLFVSLASQGQFQNVFDVPNNNNVFVLESNESFVFAGTGGNGIYRSSDDGETWAEINNGITPWYYFSLLSSGDTLFAGSFGFVHMSLNNGDSWADLNIGLDLNDDINSILKDGDFLWVGVENKGVFQLGFNSGQWVNFNTGFHNNPSVNDLIKIGTSFFAATDAGVYEFAENAPDWSLRDSGMPEGVEVNNLLFTGSEFLAATASGLYRSVDLGMTWNLITSGVTSDMSINRLAQVNNSLFAGSDAGVFQSNDSGNNWYSINQGLSNQLFVTALTAKGNNLFVGSSGSIFVNEDIPLSNSNDLEALGESITLYPNPTSDKLAIECVNLEIINIQIVDLLGRTVMLVEGNPNTVDVSKLDNGTYSIVITTAQTEIVEKFVKR